MVTVIFIFQSVRHIFVPAERKIPKVRIETRQADVLSGQRIIVAIDSWPRNSRYPLVSKYKAFELYIALKSQLSTILSNSAVRIFILFVRSCEVIDYVFVCMFV
jgi:exoribonuclease R